MSFDRVGIYKAQDADNRFIVVVENNEPSESEALHTSEPLARDEAKNLLRHFNLTENEIELRIQHAAPAAKALAASNLR